MNAVVRAVTCICAVALCAGCTLFSPVKIETTKDVLSKIPTDLPPETTHSATLLVLTPETQATYDTTRMVYSSEPYQVAYFAHNEWGETPSQMIHPLLVQTLQNTRYFRAVLTPPYFGHYTHALHTEILELKQDFTSNPPAVRLAMRFRLDRAASPNEVIATRDISVREPMREKTPYAGVVAANEATAKALREMARFVLQKAG